MPPSYSEIATVQLIKSPQLLKVTTDKSYKKYNSTTWDIAFSEGGPANNNSITLTWGTISITFTFNTTPDTSGYQLPLQGASTLTAYVSDIEDKLNLNTEFAQYFTISNLGSTLVVSPSSEAQHAASHSDNASNVTITVTQTSNASYEQNLSVVLSVQKHEQSVSGAWINPPIVHSLPITKGNSANFDLSTDFDLKPHLPPANSLNSAGTIYADALDCYQIFRLAYGNKFGSTPTTQQLTRTTTAEYIALHGGLKFNNRGLSWYNSQTNNAIWLTQQITNKNVTEDQPEYWTFFPKMSGSNQYDIKLKQFFKDGTDSTSTHSSVTLAFGRVQWLKLGFEQLGLTQNIANPTIKFQVWLEVASTKVSTTLSFNIVQRQVDYERYFLFGNSVGGLDVYRGTGKRKETLKLIRQTAQKSQAQFVTNTDYQNAQSFTFNTRAMQQYSGSLGYMMHTDLLYLKEIMIQDYTWIADIETPRFIPINILSESIDLGKDDQDVYSLKFDYTIANEEESLTEI